MQPVLPRDGVLVWGLKRFRPPFRGQFGQYREYRGFATYSPPKIRLALDELTPNTKMGDRPDRRAPHRGDYLVAHRIDGRLDPGSCFRRHGNKNDGRCKQCHK